MNRPSSLQVELVEGCTRLCTFCGLNAIRSAPGGYKRMRRGTAERTARQAAQLNPRIRVEFAMHGEPLVHPQAALFIQMFRAYLPRTQLQVTTNGVTLLKHPADQLDRLFGAGLDMVLVDLYEPERERLRASLEALPRRFDVVDFYADLAPAGWSPWHNHGRKHRGRVVLLDDISLRSGEVASRVVLNHAGSNPELPVPVEPLRKTCTNPFREVSVTWQGEVRVCCMDWKGEYVCGNVHDRSLRDIWHGAQFTAARKMLQAKDRRFAPCASCDKNAGARAGLLPKLPPPSAVDHAIIRAVTGRPCGDAWQPKRRLTTLR